MSHQALYRKWRPITFDDVVGQEHITAALRAQVEAGQAFPRLPVHRHPRHGQDDLRQNFGPGGQLPPSGGGATRATSARICRADDWRIPPWM